MRVGSCSADKHRIGSQQANCGKLNTDSVDRLYFTMNVILGICINA